MPYIKILKRYKLKKVRIFWHIKFIIILLLVSFSIGFLAWLIGSKLSTYKNISFEEIILKQKGLIIKKYQDQYGKNWKEKLKADYKEKLVKN